MADRPLTDFGERLRRAREARGISLRQVSNVTRISVRALEAVERNDLTRLPGGIFTRAFVRAYATEVGLDPEAALRDFLAQGPQDASAMPVSRTDIVDGIGDGGREGGGRRVLVAVLLIALAAAAAYGVVRWFAARQAPPARSASTSDSVRDDRAARPGQVVTADASAPPDAQRGQAVEPAAAPAAEAVVRASNEPAAPASRAARLTLRLLAQGACWVSAQPDEGATVERLLAPGDALELTAERSLVLRVGNAGALTVTINGRPARPLGGRGEVVTVRLSPETAQDFLVQ